ncbi:hypothetical protein M3Y94_01134300 [Aphelenchoides besseyi]|nr:hypothetical protein M3Y94_01134300 [Aphelenchoides besseyi]
MTFGFMHSPVSLLSRFGFASFRTLSRPFGGRLNMSTATPTDEYMKKLMKVEEQTPNVYRADFLISPAGRGIAYGGLLFSQSLQSAQHTVDRTVYAPHSMHTFFILNVDPSKSVDYRIQRVRDGRSYCTRVVQAEQEGKIVMSSQVSFCKKEESSIEHQTPMPKVPEPESLLSSVDFCRENLKKHENGEIQLMPVSQKVMELAIQGRDDDLFEVRPCSPNKYYGLEESNVESMSFWVKTKCALSDDREEHRFLVAYMTDFSLASVANRPHCSRGYIPSMILSLDHSVRFHDDDYRADEWLLYENWSPWAKFGRAFSEGRVYTHDGRLVLSTNQESLSRTKGEKSVL